MPEAEHDEERSPLSWIERLKLSPEQAEAHRESQIKTGKTTPVVDEEKVLLIRYLYWKKGWGQKRIAEYFSIAPTTISSIIRNRSWQHVYLPEDWEP